MDLEKHLHRNGTRIVKFYLHLSKTSSESAFFSASMNQTEMGNSTLLLMATAPAHGTNPLVMGDYGHSHMREIIFGGFTQSVVKSADITRF